MPERGLGLKLFKSEKDVKFFTDSKCKLTDWLGGEVNGNYHSR